MLELMPQPLTQRRRPIAEAGAPASRVTNTAFATRPRSASKDVEPPPGGDLRCVRRTVRRTHRGAPRWSDVTTPSRFTLALLAFCLRWRPADQRQDPGASRHPDGPGCRPLRGGARRRPRRRRRSPKIPVLTLIASSERHFKAGQAELERAISRRRSSEFDRAVNVLHGVAVRRPDRAADPRALRPAGRSHQRLRSARRWPTATASPKRSTSRPSIDELLALSTTFGTPAAPAGTEETRPVAISTTGHDIPIPAQSAGPGLHRAVPGPPPRLHRGRA